MDGAPGTGAGIGGGVAPMRPRMAAVTRSSMAGSCERSNEFHVGSAVAHPKSTAPIT